MRQLLFGLFFLLLSGGAMAQTGKIGFVDVQTVITSLPEYTAAQNSLNSFAETLLPQNIKDKGKQLEDKYTKYQSEEATMGEARKEVAQKEIMQLENEIGQMHQQNQTQQKLAQKEQELFGPIQQKAAELISTVAKENGFTVVFDIRQSTPVWADDSVDMMPFIRAKLGQPSK